MKAMICTSMRGIPNDIIKKNIVDIKGYLNKHFDDLIIIDNFVGYKFSTLDQLDPDYDDKNALMCLGMGLSNVMSGIDYVVLGPGFINSRGCIVEALVAMFYGKRIIALQRNYNNGAIELMDEEEFKRNLKTVLNIMINSNEGYETDKNETLDPTSILDILRG